jgi:hypothetical protein
MPNNAPSPDFKIDINGGEWKVTYTEPAGSIELDFELGLPQDIVYIPRDWWQTMPDWVRQNKDIVLIRIDGAFGQRGCVFTEF